MKKNTIINLLTFSAIALTLVACSRPVDDPNQLPDNPSIDNPTTTPSSEDKTSETTKPTPTPDGTLSLIDFNTAMSASKPTKIKTTVVYSVSNLDINLNFLSTLNIEYGPVIEAEYKYTYQKLNEIGTSDNMISTISGVDYAKGNMFGEFTEGNIHWNVGTQSDINLLKFTLTEDDFDTNDPEIHAFVLQGKIKDANLGNVFTPDVVKNVRSANIKIGIKSDLKHVDYVNLNYIHTDTSGYEAVVQINTEYFYEPVEVNIPEDF